MPKINTFCLATLKNAAYYWPITILLVAGVISLGVYLFGWEWTGFLKSTATSTTEVSGPNPSTSETTNLVAGKTLWDLAELLIIPAVLALGALWFNKQTREAEQELAEERRREDTLQVYLDTMTELILDRGLRESQPGEAVRDIARARTLSVLRVLNSERNRTVVQFLREAELFEPGEAAIVNLAGSTLKGAKLDGVNFEKANLISINLTGANLRRANLGEAELSAAKLSTANLSEANLGKAKLSPAYLDGADLSGANLNLAVLSKAILVEANLGRAILIEANLNLTTLNKANLKRANLVKANLHEAYLKEANLSEAKLNEANLTKADLSGATLTGATYDTDTQWPPGFDPIAAGAILVEPNRL
jgi:uncharacterized protein YjbI with pentapeptide repeats